MSPAVVRAVAFNPCNPGSIPGDDVICELNLFLVLVPVSDGFSPYSPVFLLHQEPTLSNSIFIKKQ